MGPGVWPQLQRKLQCPGSSPKCLNLRNLNHPKNQTSGQEIRRSMKSMNSMEFSESQCEAGICSRQPPRLWKSRSSSIIYPSIYPSATGTQRASSGLSTCAIWEPADCGPEPLFAHIGLSQFPSKSLRVMSRSTLEAQVGRGWNRTEIGCRPLNGGLNVGVILPEGNIKTNLANCR